MLKNKTFKNWTGAVFLKRICFGIKLAKPYLKPHHIPNSKSVALNRRSDPIFRGFSHFKDSMTISNETINPFSPIFRQLMEAFDANFKLKVIKWTKTCLFEGLEKIGPRHGYLNINMVDHI